jgi:voltage-gated potassium channel Kch
VLLAVAVSALVLGTIGFLQAPHLHYDFFDSFYRALLLFLFGGAVSFKVPLVLQVARFLAPVALGAAALAGIFHLFRDELQVLWIRLRVHGHVVVVGLGSAGWRLVTAFAEEGWQVVAVEIDSANPHITAARDLGVAVLIGDGREAGPLRRARIVRARFMVVACGDDGVNFDVAMAAGTRVAGRRHGVLTVFAHIAELRLWRRLKAEAVAAIDAPEFRVEFFNVFFTAARLMVDRFPPFSGGAGGGFDDSHICIVGLDGVGEGLVLRIASTWREQHPDRRLRLRMAGPSADTAVDSLMSRYPDLDRICKIDVRPGETASAWFQGGGALLDDHGGCEITKAYVALAHQGEALAAALGLHGSPVTAKVPIVVALDDETAGTARALTMRRGTDVGRGVEPFGVLSRALTPELTLQGMNELIARQKHADFLREELEAGRTSDSTVPWERLGEEYKDSNRRFADGIGAALDAVGCAIAPAPLIDARGDLFRFTDAQIELLAKREHDRWMADQLRDGWRYGAKKDRAKKTHPLLVSWGDLNEDDQEKDRQPMRDLPEMLARMGFEVYGLPR